MPLALPAATLFISQDDSDHATRKRNREMAFRVEALESIGGPKAEAVLQQSARTGDRMLRKILGSKKR